MPGGLRRIRLDRWGCHVRSLRKGGEQCDMLSVCHRYHRHL